ncbi:hypothetical protein ACOSQ2_004465 [Xanthoceras sorbifolium]
MGGGGGASNNTKTNTLVSDQYSRDTNLKIKKLKIIKYKKPKNKKHKTMEQIKGKLELKLQWRPRNKKVQQKKVQLGFQNQAKR